MIGELGGVGNDTMQGHSGSDILTGNAGIDVFVLNQPLQGIVKVTDFTVVDDTLLVSSADFGGNLIPGSSISSEQLFVGKNVTAATNASQRFIYNTTTGGLFFDADGNQSGLAAIQVAVLSNKPMLSNDDIFVTG